MTTVFTAKKILTFNETSYDAFAVDDAGTIISTGDAEHLTRQYPDAEVFPLEGELVVPGFNDAHCHVSQIVLARTRVDLTNAANTQSALRAIKERAEITTPGDWVFAQLLDDQNCPGIDRRALDEISTDHPIAVKHFSFHRAVLNTAALAEFGYVTPLDEPENGRLGVDSDGLLNGWVSESAWFGPWLNGTAPGGIAGPGDVDQEVSVLNDFNAEVHAMGITAYCDAIVTPTEYRMYKESNDRGTLTPRVSMLLWHSHFDADTWEEFDSDDHLKFAGVKCIYDGALTAGTCLCSKPYAATAGPAGMQYMSDPQLSAVAHAVSSAGARLAVHANGDLAINKVLDIFESLPEEGPRHRIEHCSIVDASIIERLKRNDVVVVPFSSASNQYGERLLEFYGEDRVDWLAAHRSLLDAEIPVAGSSDYPVTPLPPLLGIQSMVSRETASGSLIGGSQRISVVEAVRVYTHGSAHATGDESRWGQIAEGYLADFTVLGTDITRCDPQEIGASKVVSTWVGGQKVWGE